MYLKDPTPCPVIGCSCIFTIQPTTDFYNKRHTLVPLFCKSRHVASALLVYNLTQLMGFQRVKR